MVRLSPSERAEAEAKARIQGCNLSTLMRSALAAYVPGRPLADERSAIRFEASEDGST